MDGKTLSEPPDVTKTNQGIASSKRPILDRNNSKLQMETTLILNSSGEEIPSSGLKVSEITSPTLVGVAHPHHNNSNYQPKTNLVPSSMINRLYESDQNKNRIRHTEIMINPSANEPSTPPKMEEHEQALLLQHNQDHQGQQQQHPLLLDSDPVYENGVKFSPSSEKDLALMKNIRKVYIKHEEPDSSYAYKVQDETGAIVFESIAEANDGGFWSKYFKQLPKVILIQDKYQHGILKLDFGRSRTISCCQTLRFAAMTAHFRSKSEEPLCIIFKDRGCCIYSCCSSVVTYDTVPQIDTVHPFTVKTQRQWKNRAEFMVKHSDGSILAFIDKEKKFYTLTMGENLKPTMKACLIGFVITMDIMDREDTGRLNCYLRPSTYVTILFLLMLFLMIGAFLFHFITAMVLAWPKTDRGGVPCSDGVHIEHDPFLPTINFTQTSESFPSGVNRTAKDADDSIKWTTEDHT